MHAKLQDCDFVTITQREASSIAGNALKARPLIITTYIYNLYVVTIDKNNSLSCIRQSFLCHFLVERILVIGLSVVDTYYLREACAEQCVPVLYASTGKNDGYSCLLRMTQDYAWQFAHECLGVGSTLARDDKIGMLQHVVETIASQYQFSATLHLSIHELHEGIAQSTGSTSAGSLAHVVALMFGSHRSEGCRTAFKKFHLPVIGSLLRCKDMGSATRTCERIVDIGSKRHANRLQHRGVEKVVPHLMQPLLGMVAQTTKHAQSAVARR